MHRIYYGSTFKAVLHLRRNRRPSEFSKYLSCPWPYSLVNQTPPARRPFYTLRTGRGLVYVRLHSGGRNSERLCVQLPATAPTDNFALLHCTFQQGSAVPLVVDVCVPTFTFNNLQHRPNSTLLHYILQPAAAPLGKSALIPHSLAVTSYVLYASLPSLEAATLHHSPLRCATPLPGGTVVLPLGLCGLTQQLSTTSLVSQNLLQHPPLLLEQTKSTLLPTTTTTTPEVWERPYDIHIYDSHQHRLATQHRRPIAPPPLHR